MSLGSTVITFFQDYNLILAFIAGLAIGDLMIFLGILAGAGKANFFLLVLIALIGGILHDTFMYLVANTKFAGYIKKRLKISKKRNKIAMFIESMKGKNYFIPILIAKFVYGVRDAAIIYVAHNNKKFKKFILTVALADLIWLLTITFVGWLAGKGFTTILTLFKGFEKWLFLIVISILAIYFINKFIISTVLKLIKKFANF